MTSSTTFEVNDGGSFGPIGNEETNERVDLQCATINVNPGGLFRAGIDPKFGPFTLCGNGAINTRPGSFASGTAYLDSATVQIGGGDSIRLIVTDSDVTVLGDDPTVTLSASTLEVTGGQPRVNARDGSAVTVVGGEPVRVDLDGGSEGTVLGGAIEEFRLEGGSVLKLRGGAASVTRFRGDSTLNLLGGTVRSGLGVESGRTLNVTGADFRLNGLAVGELPDGLPVGGTFTGTLADGSVFVFDDFTDTIRAGSIHLIHTALPPPATDPIAVAAGVGPLGLRPTETLTLVDGGTLPDGFSAAGATLNIDGGSASSHVELADTAGAITGGTIGPLRVYSGTTLDITGGTVIEWMRAYPGSAASISGGEIGGYVVNYGVLHASGGKVGRLSAFAGSDTTLTGGALSASPVFHPGSTGHISGGTVGGGLWVHSGANITLVGAEFERDGVPVSDFGQTFSAGDIFTGVLADGTPILFRGTRDRIDGSGITLDPIALDPPDTTPIVMDTGTAPPGLRAGQTLTLLGDATFPSDTAVLSATLNVEGGIVGDEVEMYNSDMTISGGVVGHGSVNIDGVVELTAGELGAHHTVVGGSTRVYGGTVGANSVVSGGSAWFKFHADIGAGLTVGRDSTLRLTAGHLRGHINVGLLANFRLNATDVRLDGVPTRSLNQGLEPGRLLTGVLSDGSVIIMHPGDGDSISSFSTEISGGSPPAADLEPILIDAGAGPKSLRPLQTLTLAGEGTLPDTFRALDATLSIEGGSAGDGIEIARTNLAISAGSVGRNLDVYAGSVVTVTGGVIGPGATIYDNGVIDITGGRIEADLGVLSGGRFVMRDGLVLDAWIGGDAELSGGEITDATFAGAATMSGGCVGDRSLVSSNGVLDLTGGSVGSGLWIYGALDVRGGSVGPGALPLFGGEITVSGGTLESPVHITRDCGLHIVATSAAVDGSPVLLSAGMPVIVTQRDGALLEATLADGTAFAVRLNDTFDSRHDFVHDTGDRDRRVARVPLRLRR